ncbi:MAG: hypothetical protein CMP59_00385 [Flavobacteriales bacterium]|nr:hypothetical protein [Flavobacteriales bacterium]
MEAKTILLTGGLGYVGGRLSKYFADQGHKVIALSRNKTVDYPNIQVNSNTDVLKAGLLDDHKVDVLIHLASPNEIEFEKNPDHCKEVHQKGTIEWLEWAKSKTVGQFIYFSTVHVYARPLVGEFNENSLCNPQHPYSISHKNVEEHVLNYQKDHELNVKVVRLSNSFGFPAFPTSNRWTLFINDLCKQAVETAKIEIRSNPLQQRDFISLSNVCTAVESIIQSKGKDSPIYNLSSGHSTTLLEMAERIKSIAEKKLGKEIPLIFDKQKMQESGEVEISNEKLRSIGWELDQVHFEMEIEKTVEFLVKST